MTTNSSTASPISRESALAILKTACDAAAHEDYAHKYTDNEEDLRACIYHHVRDALDTDECWRVFLSYSTRRNSTDMSIRKPDLVFLRGQPVHTNPSLEILVELKNWPTIDQIIHDLNKLIELRARFPKECPDLVFFGIGRCLEGLKEPILASLSERHGIHIFLYPHDGLYQGPWPDPYRQKLKVIEAVTDEAAAL